MSNIQTYKPNFAIHPGITLLENLEYLGISQVELSERTGLTKKHISNIINGKASITPQSALKFENALGIKSSFWNNLEKNHQANLARLEEEEKVKEEAKKYIANPYIKEVYRDLSYIGFVEKLHFVKENHFKIILELRKFYGFNSLDYIDDFNLKAAFRKYNKRKINPYSIAAWLRIGQLKAQNTDVSDFDAQKLKDSLEKIISLSVKSSKEYLPEVESILSKCGVVLVCAPKLKNTQAQGAMQWISKNKVCIIIKTTNQSEDKFWFNLFHEIGHILKHGKKEIFVDFDKDGNKTEQEIEADDFAEKVLVPDFEENVSQYKDYEVAIIDLAKKYGISRSIVAGILTYKYGEGKGEAYALTNKFIGSINYTNI